MMTRVLVPSTVFTAGVVTTFPVEAFVALFKKKKMHGYQNSLNLKEIMKVIPEKKSLKTISQKNTLNIIILINPML